MGTKFYFNNYFININGKEINMSENEKEKIIPPPKPEPAPIKLVQGSYDPTKKSKPNKKN